MRHNNKDKYILLSVMIIACISIICYIAYPFFISTEQANKWNIQKFDKKKQLLENVILECQRIYDNDYQNQQNVDFDKSMLPDNIISKLERTGLLLDYVNISKEKDTFIINAHFIVHRSWNIRVLNNVNIWYSSCRKFDICDKDKNELSARMSSICLGDGWFFDVDTDWL